MGGVNGSTDAIRAPRCLWQDWERLEDRLGSSETMLACFDASRTGQGWAQVEGDLDKNEGSHAFFWDPERRQSLSVFTYDTAFKGFLSLIGLTAHHAWVAIEPATLGVTFASNAVPLALQ